MAWGLHSSNFVKWYSKKSCMILDKMFCCSYVDAQVCGEVPVDDYYMKRSTTIPTEWILNSEFSEDDDPLSPFKRTNGDGKRKFSKYNRPGLHPSLCKLSPSFGTATTVTIQTQSYEDDSDSRSVSSCETVRAANRGTETSSRCGVSETARYDVDSSFDSSFDLGIAPRSIEFNSPTKRGGSPVGSENVTGGYKKHTRAMKTRYREKVVLCHARTPEGLGRFPETNTVSEGQRLQMLIS
jgi:hypothetical protein